MKIEEIVSESKLSFLLFTVFRYGACDQFYCPSMTQLLLLIQRNDADESWSRESNAERCGRV